MISKIIRILFGRRSLVIFLLLVQAWFMFYMIWQTSTQNIIVKQLTIALSFIVVLYIANRREKEGYKLTWVVLIMTLPVVGGALYLIFRIQSASKGLRKKSEYYDKKGRELLKQNDDVLEQMRAESPCRINQADYLYRNVGFPIYRNTKTEYLSPGELFFERLKEQLKKAEHYIFIETFIIENGVMWGEIMDILKEKAAAGVDVRLIYDDMGCLLTLPKHYDKELTSMGIKTVIFNPFRAFWTTLQNNRDHRKIAVIDGYTAFTGGCNLADEYINRIDKYGHWKDSCIMLRGEAAWTLTVMFLEMWNLINKTDEDFTAFVPHRYFEREFESDGYVLPYGDSPIDEENVGEHVYRRMITNATKYVYIMTPYLILDESMISDLTLAAKSGIDVRIIMPGIPDKKLVYMTSRSYYRTLLSAGVRIYEYTPGFVHSKVFVCDGITASVGTANLDFRSMYLHYECGVLLHRSSVIADIEKDYLDTVEKCVEITPELEKRGIFTRLMQIIMRLCAPLM